MHGIFLSQSLLTSQSLRAAIGPLQFSLRHWNLRNVTLQTRLSTTRDFFRQHSTFAWLYNAAASPASRLRSAGSLAISFIENKCILFKAHPSAKTTHRLPFSRGDLNDFLSNKVSLRALLMLYVNSLGSPRCQEGTSPHFMGCRILSGRASEVPSMKC